MAASPAWWWLVQCGTSSSEAAQADLIAEGLHGLQRIAAASPALAAGYSVRDIVGNNGASSDKGVYVLTALSLG